MESNQEQMPNNKKPAGANFSFLFNPMFQLVMRAALIAGAIVLIYLLGVSNGNYNSCIEFACDICEATGKTIFGGN